MPADLSSVTRALAAARAVASEQGVECAQAEVAHAGSNVVVHLRPAPVIARVMTGTAILHPDPRRWLEGEVAVLEFLAPWGGAMRPSPLLPPGPYEHGGLWLTCWEWIEHRREPALPSDPDALARALRELHDRLSEFTGELGSLHEIRDWLEGLAIQLRPTAALDAGAIAALRTRLDELDGEVFESRLPARALHGDASLSNLLVTDAGRRWTDFEDVCRGPVQWDVAGFVSSMRHRGLTEAFVERWLDAYGGIGSDELTPFFAAHDLYDEIWRNHIAQARG